MATTTNLSITKLNSSDYVSVDYVTESGTSGEWWYRKWKSGRGEGGIYVCGTYK